MSISPRPSLWLDGSIQKAGKKPAPVGRSIFASTYPYWKSCNPSLVTRPDVYPRDVLRVAVRLSVPPFTETLFGLVTSSPIPSVLPHQMFVCQPSSELSLNSSAQSSVHVPGMFGGVTPVGGSGCGAGSPGDVTGWSITLN